MPWRIRRPVPILIRRRVCLFAIGRDDAAGGGGGGPASTQVEEAEVGFGIVHLRERGV